MYIYNYVHVWYSCVFEHITLGTHNFLWFLVQPALSAYQCNLHHDIHGPNEPLPQTLAKRLKSVTVKTSANSTLLPQLPEQLLEKQRSLTQLREVSQHRPLVHQASDSVAGCGDIQKVTPLRSKRKDQISGVIRKRSSAMLPQSDPSTVITSFSPPLESLIDPLEIIERLRREPELGFLYLTPVDDHKSIHYNPYNLR